MSEPEEYKPRRLRAYQLTTRFQAVLPKPHEGYAWIYSPQTMEYVEWPKEVVDAISGEVTP